MEKMTKREVFTALIDYATTGTMTIDMETLKAFAQNEIDLMDKRGAKAKERTAKKRAEEDVLTSQIQAVLTNEFETTAEIASKIEGEDISLSKVVYRLNQLVANGVAEKTDVKIPATETSKARTAKGFRLIA